MGIRTRNEMRSYMDCGGTYCEIGAGFTEFTENRNPREYARQYISETDERVDIVGFAPSVTYAFEVCGTDNVQEKLLTLTNNGCIGDDAHVTVVTAFLCRPQTVSGTVNPNLVEAYRRVYTVCPAKLGSGTEALVCAGTLKACGDMEKGTFTVSTKVFSPDT